MIITGNINFFSIIECGLYKNGDSKSYGLDIQETLSLVESWVKGKPLADTISWDPSNSRSSAPKCYCRDIYKDELSGDYVFVLWKSDSDSAGTLWGAQEDAQTGQGEVIEYTNKFNGRKVIWGRPCYYWFIPSLDTIASIKFDHSVCDSSMMQDWLSRVITNKASHPNKKKTQTPTGQIRFEFSDEFTFDSAGKFAYRFDARLKSIDTSSAEMHLLAQKVNAIIRRETIRLDTGYDERARWVKIFDVIEYLRPKHNSKSRQIEIRAEAQPSADELRRIIEKFAKEERKNGDWDNVGFETDEGIVWADKYRLHTNIKIDVKKVQVLTASELHQRLSAERSILLCQAQKNHRNKKIG